MKQEKIVHAAVELRAAAPMLWEQFVQSLREYSFDATTNMLNCPPELLQRAQGYAAAIAELSIVLSTAHDIRLKNLERKFRA